jgi:hypothetical protein
LWLSSNKTDAFEDGRWVFLKVLTDEGVYGVGEATLQIAARAPIFYLLETMLSDVSQRGEVCTEQVQMVEGTMPRLARADSELGGETGLCPTKRGELKTRFLVVSRGYLHGSESL